MDNDTNATVPPILFEGEQELGETRGEPANVGQ
jgi:hypothetical protein